MFKRLFCRHKNVKENWGYPNGFEYNERFDVAQTTRQKQVVCKDCGKVLKVRFVQWIAHDQICEEVKKDYFSVTVK